MFVVRVQAIFISKYFTTIIYKLYAHSYSLKKIIQILEPRQIAKKFKNKKILKNIKNLKNVRKT